MSLYADYLTQRTEDHIIENDMGFITWRYMPNNQVYIVDLYVRPESRGSHVASDLADMVVSQAKEKGCTELFGTVVPRAKNSDISLKVLQAYGMSLHSANHEIIFMRKEI